MSDPQNPETLEPTPEVPPTNPQAVSPDVQALVDAAVSEQLKTIKENLDKAYKARNDAQAKVAEFERAAREAEVKRLQEEGKHREAFDLQLAEERTARQKLEAANVELTRDIELRKHLSANEFRNDNAMEMAYRELVNQLVRDDKGQWVHRSGASIGDSVKTFVSNDDNAFLLKPKVSSGAGGRPVRSSSPASSSAKSLFEMTQEEVLTMAREGKLRR